MASKRTNTTAQLVEAASRALEITSRLDAAARSNPALDALDRRRLSELGSYIANIAVGLSGAEARGVLARAVAVLKSSDSRNARAIGFVESAMGAHDKDEAANNLVALLSWFVNRRFGSLWSEDLGADPRVVGLLERPGKKKAVGILALLGQMAGVDGTASEPDAVAKKYDNARRDLRNRKVGRK